MLFFTDRGASFLWRHCYDLRYQSQRDNEMYQALHRALRMAQKIRQCLGGSGNTTEPFPERPKGMHLKTYMRMLREHHDAEMEQLIGMRGWLNKLERKLG